MPVSCIVEQFTAVPQNKKNTDRVTCYLGPCITKACRLHTTPRKMFARIPMSVSSVRTCPILSQSLDLQRVT